MHDQIAEIKKEKTVLDKNGEGDIYKLGHTVRIGTKKARYVRWNSQTKEYEFYCNVAGRKIEPITI